jgi:hypothetical protein
VHLISASQRPLLRPVASLLAALFLVGILVSFSAPTAAFADDSDGISGAPASESGADDRTRLSYQASPGQHIDDFYVLRNTGTTPQSLKVFATDAYNTDDGSYGLLDTDATPKDAGNWITFDGGAKQLTVPLDPGATQVIPFFVDVPADAGPGDHAAGIVISVTAPAGEILVDRRVATRVYVRVPGELQPNLTISNITASYEPQLNPIDGQSTITFTVRNAGNVALGANMVIGANALFGIPAGEVVHQELSEMLPGATRTVTIPVHGVGQWGYLNAYAKLAPTVDAGALDPGPLREVSRDTVVVAVPWWLLLLLAIALIVWLVIRMRRKRDEKNAQAWYEYTQAEARRTLLEEGQLVAAAPAAGPGGTGGLEAGQR